MHPNEQLLIRLFELLNLRQHEAMADCYQLDATFRDIAFTLHGRPQIHAMWKMICVPNARGDASNIKATVLSVAADDEAGFAEIIDDYTFRDTKRRVHNRATSFFSFQGGKILHQNDDCDTVTWGKQALGGVKGLLVGRIGPLRRFISMRTLQRACPKAFGKE